MRAEKSFSNQGSLLLNEDDGRIDRRHFVERFHFDGDQMPVHLATEPVLIAELGV